MRTRHPKRSILAAMLGALLSHSDATTLVALDPQPLPVSKGVYRLPYTDNTSVMITRDHLNHPTTLNRIDMVGQGGGPYTVVAAAAGWIRIIVENNNINCCNGSCPNNYVWIEHPNGEWSKYSHMTQNSVSGFGRSVDEWVNAGDPLGFEDDIGMACGAHVHFEVGVPNHVELPPSNPLDPSDPDPDSPPDTTCNWFTSGGFLVSDGIQDDVLFEDPDNDGVNNPDDDVNRQNRIPVFCQVGFANAGDTFTAGPCDDVCNDPVTDFSGVTVTAAGSPYYKQAAGAMDNPDGDFIIQANAGAAIRSGDRVTLSPGFHAELGSYFSASIGPCDSPGGTGD